MVDCTVRFATDSRFLSGCIECGDPVDVVYAYAPFIGMKVKVPYCLDCAIGLSLVERASDAARRDPENVFRLRLEQETERARLVDGVWWLVRD